MWFLDGVGGEGEVLELVVVAGMGDGLLGEESVEDIESFIGDSAPLPEVGDTFDLQVLGNDSAEPQAENQPTVGKDVGGYGGLGELDGTAKSQAGDTCAEPDGLGVLSCGRENGEGLQGGDGQELGGPIDGVAPGLGIDPLLHGAPLIAADLGDAELHAGHDATADLKWEFTSRPNCSVWVVTSS